MLHLAAVSSELLALIQAVCAEDAFAPFRLVGGTALSLYLGHRQSTDADFFADRAFDKKVVEQTLLTLYPAAIKLSEMPYGFTWAVADIKLEFYDWKAPFLKPAFHESGLRLASLEDVAAYKLDAVVGRKTEKDYRDAEQLCSVFPLKDLTELYRRKFPYNDVKILLDHLTLVDEIEPDATLRLLQPRAWETVRDHLLNAVQDYFQLRTEEKSKAQHEREQRLSELIARRTNKP